MDKIENLQKKEKEELQKGMDYFNASSLYGKLTNNKKQIVFDVILDLLVDKKIANCGFYLQQLLNENEMTCTRLANYIYGYMFCVEGVPDGVDEKHIKSRLEGILKSNTFGEENKLIKYICDFFSISEEVLMYGYGKKYTINMDEVANVFDKKKITTEEFLKEITSKLEEHIEVYRKNCDAYILNSHKVFADTIADTYYLSKEEEKRLLMVEKEFSLIDENAFFEYFMRLKENERTAVLHLMENMKKELDNQ